METKKYAVSGMSCAACSAHVEKETRGVKGGGGRRGKEREGARPASPSPLGKESVYVAQ